MNDLILTLCLGVAAFVCAVALYVEIRSRLHILQIDHKVLGDEYRALSERVRKLEQANPKRINLTSLEEIENAMAELAVLEMDNDLRSERITSIKSHLARAHTPTNGKLK